MAPVFKKVVADYNVEVEEVNITEGDGRERAVEYGVRSIPAFVVPNMNSGAHYSLSGMQTESNLRAFLDIALKGI
ncbi:hypothetical protein [Escherichia phage MLP3]|nr:hypothetical protein [Escherichia phage MLP3]